MNPEQAFWDASALVPLCCEERSTATARKFLLRFLPVVWWGSTVEIQGAFARRLREGKLSADGHRKAVQNLLDLQSQWIEISPPATLREDAIALLHRHKLRAADALQLASALAWRGPATRSASGTFIAGDLQLCHSAAVEGFHVEKTL